MTNRLLAFSIFILLTACSASLDTIRDSVENIANTSKGILESVSAKNNSTTTVAQSDQTRPNLGTNNKGDNFPDLNNWDRQSLPVIWRSDDFIIKNGVQTGMIGSVYSHPPYGIGIAFTDYSNPIHATAKMHASKCEETPVIQLLSKNPIALNIQKFAASRSPTDLPLRPTINAMLKVINHICPETKIAAVTFRAQGKMPEGLTTKELYDGKPWVYQGWAIKKDNWQLSDIPNSETIAITQSHRLIRKIKMNFRGSCDTNLVALLRRVTNDVSLAEYSQSTSWFSSSLKEICPSVEIVNFIIDKLPGRYFCKSGGDCFITTTYSGPRTYKTATLQTNGTTRKPGCFSSLSCMRSELEWDIDTSALKYDEIPPPLIGNAKDISEILAAGRFDLIKDYREDLELYYAAFIEEYSNSCRHHLKSPIEVTSQLIEKTVDSGGFVVAEDRSAPTVKIQVEKAYSKYYMEYSERASFYFTRQLFESWVNSMGSRRPGAVPTGVVSSITSRESHIEELFSEGCVDKKVNVIYDNLLNFAENKEPIIGLFTTEKKIIEPVIHLGGSSAPATIEYLGYTL